MSKVTCYMCNGSGKVTVQPKPMMADMQAMRDKAAGALSPSLENQAVVCDCAKCGGSGEMDQC